MAVKIAEPTKASKRTAAEIGVTVAMSLLLALFNLSPFPAGGQISLEMLPILVLARMRGFKAGAAAGLCYGMLHIVQEPIIYHPLQLILDYPLAYSVLGLCGLGCFKNSEYLSLICASAARLLCHTLSGVIFADVFLSMNENSASPWLLSLSYNASFLAVPVLIMLIFVPPIHKTLKSAIKK